MMTPLPPSQSSTILVPNLSASWQTPVDEYVVALQPLASDPAVLMVATATGELLALHAQTGEILGRVQAHQEACTQACVVVSPQGFANPQEGLSEPAVLTAGDGGLLCGWRWQAQAKTWEPVFQTRLGRHWVEHLAVAYPYVLAALDRQVVVLSLTGQEVRRITLPKAVLALAWQPGSSTGGNQPRFATACYGQVALWQLGNDTPTLIREMPFTPTLLRWQPRGRFLAYGCREHAVFVIPLGPHTTGRPEDDLRMEGFTHKVSLLAWSEDNRYLATGGGPDPIVWSFAGKGPAHNPPLELLAHRAVLSAGVFQSGNPLASHRLATASAEGSILIWNLPTVDRPEAVALASPETQGGEITTLHWSSTHPLLSGDANGLVSCWNL